jgi:hypothetical protein
VSARARAFVGGPERWPRWPRLLAALVGSDNGWKTPPSVPAGNAADSRHRTGPAVPSPRADRTIPQHHRR